MKSSREVREAATLAERERIIKLLEEMTGIQTFVEPTPNKPVKSDVFINRKLAIALIKGENK